MVTRKMRLIYLVVATILLAFCGCDKVSQHDFDNLRDEVEKNTEEISTLKDLTTSLQAAINSGQVITGVKDVTKVENGETIKGIEVTFSGTGGVKTIWNGAQGKTPFMWINTNGNWATFYDKIPADRDNANYEIKDVNGKPISAKGFKVEVINKNGFIAFKTIDPNTGATTEIVTAVPFDPEAKIVQAVTESGSNYIFKIDGIEYTLMRDIKYPTSITMLAKTAYVEKGKTTAFNIKVNPSNAEFKAEDLSIAYVPTMTRATSVITNPDFVKIESCVAVASEDTKSGEYTITLSWLKDIPQDDRALFIVVSTKNNKGEDIEIISSTPVYLTEEMVAINNGFINDFNEIVMFQGETYTGEVTLTQNDKNQYIWDKGYVNTIAVTPNAPTSNITITEDPSDKFKFAVQAKVLNPTGAVKNYPSTVKITDIDTPNNSINKALNIKVYPVVTELFAHTTTPNNWIPIARKDNYVTFDIAQKITDAGFLATIWDVACTSTKYLLNGTEATPLPSYIDFHSSDVANKQINIDILPEILAGKHKIEYTVTATAKKGMRPASLPQTKVFTIVVEFEIKAPVFHLALKNPFVNPTEVMAVLSTRGTYTTIVKKDIKASDIFQESQCVNHSNDYKTEYGIADDSPAYAYAVGSGAQGLMFRTFPVSPNWNAATTVQLYSKLATGQEIPVFIGDYVTTLGNGSHTSLAIPGVVDVVFKKMALDHVATMPYKTLTKACFNYTTLQTASFNINNEFTIHGEDATNNDLDPSCIASVKYEVLENASPIVGMHKKLLTITPDGVATAALNYTWTDNMPVDQPIKITMTDIWGNEKSTTVYIRLNSNSVPTRPI